MYSLIFEYIGYIMCKYHYFDYYSNYKFKIYNVFIETICYIAGLYFHSYDLNTRLYSYPIISTLGALGGAIFFLFA